MEELVPAFQFTDDSGNVLGSIIDEAYKLLKSLASDSLSQDLRKELFGYCILAYENGYFSGWDWHLSMLELAFLLFRDEEEVNRILTLLDQVQSESYDIERSQQIRLEILKKIAGEQEAVCYMEENLENPEFRRIAIQKAMEAGEYDKAIGIAEDGIRQDASKYGLLLEWHDRLLQIAIQQNDRTEILTRARYLLLNNHRDKLSYFRILKQYLTAGEWPDFLKILIRDIGNHKQWPDYDLIAEIYVHEEMWEELMAYLVNNFSNDGFALDFIKRWEKHLKQIYPQELTDLYESGILDLMASNTGRSYYKTACRFIRRMIKLGSKEQAQRLVTHLRETYRYRRALLDELTRV